MVSDIFCRAEKKFLDFFKNSFLPNFEEEIKKGKVLKDLRIKKTIECINNNLHLFIKIYKKGNLWERTKAFFKKPKAIKELENALKVGERGIEIFPPIAVGVKSGESFAIFEKLEGWEILSSFISNKTREPKQRNYVIYSYGNFARLVHDAGVLQYDFNPTNVLYTISDSVVKFKLTDFEKVKFYKKLSWGKRLWSLAKINRIKGVSRQDRLRFLKAYIGNYVEEQNKLKYIIAKILRYNKELSKRDSIRLTKNCVSENRNFGIFIFEKLWGYYRKPRPDVQGEGITIDDLKKFLRPYIPLTIESIPKELLILDCADVIREWKRANVEAEFSRGKIPLACVVTKRAKGVSFGNGYILFNKSSTTM